MSQDSIPKEGKILSLLLHSCGISECEPKVISALQEYSYNFVGRLLYSASKFSDVASRENLDPSDVKLASSKLRLQSARPNTREYYLEVMAKVNSRPLPPPVTSGPYGPALFDENSRSASFKITALRG